MAIKRTAPVVTQQELQISDRVVYRLKPTATTSLAKPGKSSEPLALRSFLLKDLLKTTLTTLVIVAIVLVIMWQGWLK